MWHTWRHAEVIRDSWFGRTLATIRGSPLTLSLPSSKSTFSHVVPIGSTIIFHLSKLWKAKFSILCDVIFLVRLQGKFDIDHSWEWKAKGMVSARDQFLQNIAQSGCKSHGVWHLGIVVGIGIVSRYLCEFLFAFALLCPNATPWSLALNWAGSRPWLQSPQRVCLRLGRANPTPPCRRLLSSQPGRNTSACMLFMRLSPSSEEGGGGVECWLDQDKLKFLWKRFDTSWPHGTPFSEPYYSSPGLVKFFISIRGAQAQSKNVPPAPNTAIGRFRKHNATSNATSNATWYVIFDRGGLSRTCCLRRYWRENCVEGPQKQGAALRTSENNSLRCESQALATSWFTGSRAQAIRRHVTSRFGVELCFLNLPNMTVWWTDFGEKQIKLLQDWPVTRLRKKRALSLHCSHISVIGHVPRKPDRAQ